MTSGRQVSAQAEAGTLPAACRDQVPVAALRHRHSASCDLSCSSASSSQSLVPRPRHLAHRTEPRTPLQRPTPECRLRPRHLDALRATRCRNGRHATRVALASRWCLAAKLPELGWGICLARSSCCRVIGWACSSQRDLLQPRARGWRVVGADSASTRRCNLAYSSARAHSKGAAYIHRSSCEVFTAARRRGQSPLRSKPRGRRDGEAKRSDLPPR